MSGLNDGDGDYDALLSCVTVVAAALFIGLVGVTVLILVVAA